MSTSIVIECATLAKTADSSNIASKRKIAIVVTIIDKIKITNHPDSGHSKSISRST